MWAALNVRNPKGFNQLTKAFVHQANIGKNKVLRKLKCLLWLQVTQLILLSSYVTHGPLGWKRDGAESRC